MLLLLSYWQRSPPWTVIHSTPRQYLTECQVAIRTVTNLTAREATQGCLLSLEETHLHETGAKKAQEQENGFGCKGV